MKRSFKPREIALMILPVVGLGLVAVWHGLYPAPSGTRQEQEEQIEEAALVRELQENNGTLKPHTIYIKVNGLDATSFLVARLAHRNIVLRPQSETSTIKKGIESVVVENKTGAFSSVYGVNPIVWNSSSSATVSINVFSASLCAGGSDYQVTWNGRKWVAEKGEVTWVS